MVIAASLSVVEFSSGLFRRGRLEVPGCSVSMSLDLFFWKVSLNWDAFFSHLLFMLVRWCLTFDFRTEVCSGDSAHSAILLSSVCNSLMDLLASASKVL